MRLTILALAVALGGCSWVRLTPAGENVAVLTMAEVANCTQVAETTVTVRDRVVFARSPERVTQELHVLARNSAATRNGDAVVPTGPVQEGSRSYNIYRCRP